MTLAQNCLYLSLKTYTLHCVVTAVEIVYLEGLNLSHTQVAG